MRCCRLHATPPPTICFQRASPAWQADTILTGDGVAMAKHALSNQQAPWWYSGVFVLGSCSASEPAVAIYSRQYPYLYLSPASLGGALWYQVTQFLRRGRRDVKCKKKGSGPFRLNSWSSSEPSRSLSLTLVSNPVSLVQLYSLPVPRSFFSMVFATGGDGVEEETTESRPEGNGESVGIWVGGCQ